MIHDARHPDVQFLTQTVDRAFDLISFGIDVSNFGIGLYTVVVNLIKVFVNFGVERPHPCTIVYDLSARFKFSRIIVDCLDDLSTPENRTL